MISYRTAFGLMTFHLVFLCGLYYTSGVTPSWGFALGAAASLNYLTLTER